MAELPDLADVQELLVRYGLSPERASELVALAADAKRKSEPSNTPPQVKTPRAG